MFRLLFFEAQVQRFQVGKELHNLNSLAHLESDVTSRTDCLTTWVGLRVHFAHQVELCFVQNDLFRFNLVLLLLALCIWWSRLLLLLSRLDVVRVHESVCSVILRLGVSIAIARLGLCCFLHVVQWEDSFFEFYVRVAL